MLLSSQHLLVDIATLDTVRAVEEAVNLLAAIMPQLRSRHQYQATYQFQSDTDQVLEVLTGQLRLPEVIAVEAAMDLHQHQAGDTVPLQHPVAMDLHPFLEVIVVEVAMDLLQLQVVDMDLLQHQEAAMDLLQHQEVAMDLLQHQAEDMDLLQPQAEDMDLLQHQEAAMGLLQADISIQHRQAAAVEVVAAEVVR